MKSQIVALLGYLRIRYAKYAIRNTRSRGFTLIETLAAVTLLIVAIVSPMLLTERSLTSAYYARDQITASYLAQEAIEAIHQIRDDNILTIAQNPTSGVKLFDGIPDVASNCTGVQTYFTVDATKTSAPQVVGQACGHEASKCPMLQKSVDGLYGYGDCADSSCNTSFKRSVSACYTDPSQDEVQITVTVFWQTSPFPQRSFTMSEDLYRWIADGSAQG